MGFFRKKPDKPVIKLMDDPIFRLFKAVQDANAALHAVRAEGIRYTFWIFREGDGPQQIAVMRGKTQVYPHVREEESNGS